MSVRHDDAMIRAIVAIAQIWRLFVKGVFGEEITGNNLRRSRLYRVRAARRFRDSGDIF